MSDKREKNQLVLAFTEEGRSEAPKASQEGTESLTAKCETERPASHEQLMEEVCERENCWQAYKRVKANKGSPGIDGMKVGELSGYLKQHWPSIREQLLRGTYQPQPVRRVEIPKPDGGMRKLGIPTVLDRLIQQAVMQVLQRRWDPTFSEHSHGFEHRIADRRILRLIRKWLRAGVSEEGVWAKTEVGTPQGAVVTPRTQKITWLLGGSGRARAHRLRLIGNSAGLRNRDRMTDG